MWRACVVAMALKRSNMNKLDTREETIGGYRFRFGVMHVGLA
jgi:hypothetical protein